MIEFFCLDNGIVDVLMGMLLGTERYQRMQEEICKLMHFTSLKFNRIDDMVDAIGLPKCKLCTYCFDGKE